MEGEDVLVEWINTFEISKPCKNMNDLRDGIILIDVFAEVRGYTIVYTFFFHRR